ncbi:MULTISPECIES: hypothetical protein [unclassified Paenibacillus]|uniref:hypothetical protein n=1 Tax=unclassified Paenibacillus TaxID=185978 RepID=UPI00083958AA|nr:MULTISPECIES: hypothetical protein [unclassified Paenibacillus]NWL87566.1 hypothetical protein [Paenibacillus sp. 79R4]
MDLGDWIFTAHNGNKITGFITDMAGDWVDIFVTIPQRYGTITRPISEVWTHDDKDVVLSPDDIPALIDLSLQIKDEEWFRKWAHELSLWRPASELENLISRQ